MPIHEHLSLPKRSLRHAMAAAAALLFGAAGCSQPPCPESPTSPPVSEPAPPPPPAEPAAAKPAEPPELSYTKALGGVSSIDEALTKVKAALKQNGFGIITEIDVQATMKKKLDVDMKPFWILGACNPPKALQAVQADPQMGLLLPCKVIVYEKAEGGFMVAIARPHAMFSLVQRPELASLADDVDAGLRKAFDAL